MSAANRSSSAAVVGFSGSARAWAEKRGGTCDVEEDARARTKVSV